MPAAKDANVAANVSPFVSVRNKDSCVTCSSQMQACQEHMLGSQRGGDVGQGSFTWKGVVSTDWSWQMLGVHSIQMT